MLAGSGPAAVAGSASWAHQNASIASNGAVTVKSLAGGSYASTQNPSGASAKTNQNAATQPPTVLIQSSSQQYGIWSFNTFAYCNATWGSTCGGSSNCLVMFSTGSGDWVNCRLTTHSTTTFYGRGVVDSGKFTGVVGVLNGYEYGQVIAVNAGTGVFTCTTSPDVYMEYDGGNRIQNANYYMGFRSDNSQFVRCYYMMERPYTNLGNSIQLLDYSSYAANSASKDLEYQAFAVGGFSPPALASYRQVSWVMARGGLGQVINLKNWPVSNARFYDPTKDAPPLVGGWLCQNPPIGGFCKNG